MGCAPLEITFTNLSINTTLSYWYFGDGTVSNSINPHHTFNAPGTYSVTLISADTSAPCNKADTLFIEDYIHVLSESAVRSDFKISSPPCNPGAVLFENTSTTAQKFQWDFGDGQSSEELNPVHTYSANGNYNITLIAIDTTSICNSSDTNAYIQFVTQAIYADSLFSPNVFTPNGDGQNDYFEIYGIDSSCINIKLSIYNRWGNEIFEAEGMEVKWDGTQDGEILAGGIYFYIIKGDDFKKSGSVTLLR